MPLAFYAWKKYDHRAFFVVPGFVVFFYDAVWKLVNLVVFGQWTWGILNIMSLSMFAFLYWVIGYRFPTWTVPVVLLSYLWSALDGFQYSYGFGAPLSAQTAFYPNFKEVVSNLAVVVALGLQVRYGGLKPEAKRVA